MKKFIAIIGYSKSGKSAIIRSLTGCGGKRTGNFFRDLRVYIMENLTVNPLRRLYVIPDSFQENPKATISQLWRFLRAVLEDRHALGVVMAIQPTDSKKRIRIEQIFSLLRRIGGFEIRSFVINPGRNNNGVIPRDMQNRLDLNIEPFSLNARNFTYFNARIIQQRTNILFGR
ncbi:MAG: hypothetical protein WCY09_01785 [Candidatus Omnitrophota bacterium]